VIWSQATMQEFSAGVAAHPVAILPVGALEEHGSHLPLGLDYMHARALAQAVGAQARCWVAPAVPYGMCKSTRQHPGTAGIEGETLRHLIHDIAIAIFNQGVKALCILTGHAGGTHVSSLIEVGERLAAAEGREVAVVCVLDLLEEAAEFLECEGDSHAGEVETSLALHLWPDLVKGGAPREFPTFPRFRLVRDKLAHWPGGVWGDPTLASEDKGRRIFQCEVRALAEIVSDLAARV